MGLKSKMHNYKFLPYNKNLIFRARELRKNQTEAEFKFLSEILKSDKLKKFKFTCQKPLDVFIVDFYCSSQSLVVEIDGDIHLSQKERDKERDNILKEKFGLKVLRYTNKEVLDNANWVLEDLVQHIENHNP